MSFNMFTNWSIRIAKFECKTPDVYVMGWANKTFHICDK